MFGFDLSRIRRFVMAAIVLALLGALGSLPGPRGVIAQGFEGVFRDGSSQGPSVRGQSAIPGLYFNSKGVGFTSHLMSGFASIANLPVVTTCGTAPAITGNDAAFKLTVGTSASNACTVTFGTAYATAPICVVQNATTGAGANVYAVAAGTIIWSSALADSTVLYVHCIGVADG